MVSRGLLGNVAQTKGWRRVGLPHVLQCFRGQQWGIINPGVEGGIDGELPLQFAVLRGRRLLELTPGTGSWRLQSVARETSHLQTGGRAGDARHPQLSLLQAARILYGLRFGQVCFGIVLVVWRGKGSGGISSRDLLLLLMFSPEGGLVRFCSPERQIARFVSVKLARGGIPGSVSCSHFLDLSLGLFLRGDQLLLLRQGRFI